MIGKIEACLNDQEMAARLKATSAHMQSHNGQEKAARILVELAEKNA